jgi:phosphotransferase system HPr-like phosphotransfer protein
MLLTAGVSKDHRIRLVADGADEDAAIESLVNLVESGLGEPGAA